MSNAILAAGTDMSATAEATDLTLAELKDCLSGARSFTFGQLVAIGGLTRTPTSRLLAEEAA